MVECLLTLRRIYEVERNEGKRSPRRPFALSPRAGTPNVSGHQPLRLSQRHSSPFTPDINYQAVQQVCFPARSQLAATIMESQRESICRSSRHIFVCLRPFGGICAAVLAAAVACWHASGCIPECYMRLCSATLAARLSSSRAR